MPEKESEGSEGMKKHDAITWAREFFGCDPTISVAALSGKLHRMIVETKSPLLRDRYLEIVMVLDTVIENDIPSSYRIAMDRMETKRGD